ncbi:hypothetical protein HMPREF1210_03367 [Paenisporosarcina sp. HGH0030]|uniref:Type 1 glutamine amidotransferase-like domain-containing protein n=1 Tax=Paenisporosarcina sp. HGH0030 TaxID=1078085 RepID=UPI00034EC2C3|nr:Type 1 glutamine amidotransferase-like domain-containing protein [Paenisporosarcina sp. HGH0030]EPD49468.1 hypothetical protein HMPREF1210_03367 [Paenisporosarcina sp. HGH0030]
MSKLLLTSTGFFHQKVREQFNALISNRKFAVIITTASAQKELNPFVIQARVDLLGMGIEQVTFLDVEREPIDCLQAADVIYLNGGNPFRLLHALRESGAEKLLQKRSKEDSVIVGVSAGAVVLGASIRIIDWFSPSLNTMNLKNFKGCELYKSSLFPHADRIDLFPGTTPIEERIQAFEESSGEHVLRLEDNEFKILKI